MSRGLVRNIWFIVINVADIGPDVSSDKSGSVASVCVTRFVFLCCSSSWLGRTRKRWRSRTCSEAWSTAWPWLWKRSSTTTQCPATPTAPSPARRHRTHVGHGSLRSMIFVALRFKNRSQLLCAAGRKRNFWLLTVPLRDSCSWKILSWSEIWYLLTSSCFSVRGLRPAGGLLRSAPPHRIGRLQRSAERQITATTPPDIAGNRSNCVLLLQQSFHLYIKHCVHLWLWRPGANPVITVIQCRHSGSTSAS